jgi:hypothetical protein
MATLLWPLVLICQTDYRVLHLQIASRILREAGGSVASAPIDKAQRGVCHITYL